MTFVYSTFIWKSCYNYLLLAGDFVSSLRLFFFFKPRWSCYLRKRQICLFLPKLHAFFVCFLIALARTSILMLKRSCEMGHPYLKPDLSGKASGFSSNMIFPVGLYYKYYLSRWRSSFLFLVFWVFFVFYHEWRLDFVTWIFMHPLII